MIVERLDVLPDVLLLHRPAVNDLSIADCVILPLSVDFFFPVTNKIVVD